MTERKPQGMSFESWIDRQIREAQERGDFDNLEGAGKPIPGISGPEDELWWVHKLMKREGLVHLPPTLALQKEAEVTLARAREAKSEDGVRRIVDELNNKILDAIAKPPAGPPLRLVPYDIDKIVDQWRTAHPVPTTHEQQRTRPVAPRGHRAGRWWRWRARS